MKSRKRRRSHYALLLTTSLFSLSLPAIAQSAAGYPGLYAEPGISPDGTRIAFVSGYDIWEVPAAGGQAHLLIANEADDSRPLYSPDGNYLAFTSTRTGRGDIYVLGFKDGSLRRITYADSYEEISGWSPDGKYIYFHSSGKDISSMNDISRVQVDGGTPMPVTADRYASEYFAAASPDNTLLAFSAKGISSRQWWRKGSSHLDQSEIWLYKLTGNDNKSGSYEKLIEHGSRNVWPLWSADGKELFFISDRNGTQNIWSKKITGGGAQALTSFNDGRVLWPSIDKKGTTIAFERDMGIWKYDINTKKATQIPITLSGMNTGPVTQHLKENSGFSDLTVSADGKKIAFISHGHVFVTGTQGGESFAVTKGNSIESSLDWNPAGNVLVYNSWRNGKFLLYQYDFTSRKETVLTKEGDDDGASFSPDGSWLAYIRSGKELRVINTKTGADKLLYGGYFGNTAFARSNSVSWSPDSKWIAFFSHGTKSLRNVSVIPVTGGTAIPVSFLANSSGNNLSWTADGKSIVFTTGQRTEETKVARVDLIPVTATYKEDELMDLFKEKPAGAAQGGGQRTKPKPDSVYIEVKGIGQRMNLLPLGVSVNSVSVSNDGKTLLLSASVAGQQHLFTYPVNPVRGNAVLKQLTMTPGMKTGARFSPDDKTVYYLEQGRIAAISVDSRTTRNINTTAEMDIDFSTEKHLVLDQAWKALQDGFYDPGFHKTDWKNVHEKYKNYMPLVKNSSELYRLMNLMIGELNASHSGASAGGGGTNEASTAHLGLRFDRITYEKEGKFKITEVIMGGPADISGKIKPGDLITAVNGIALDKAGNLDQLLDNKIGTKLLLTVSSADKNAVADVALSPVNSGAEKQLLYRQWVQEQRAYVEKISGGKLGYVHMFDMSAGSLDQLYIDLDAANINKQGIVIDVRNNNGGFVNAYALDVFARKGYMTMTSRGLPPAPARTQLGQRSFGAPTILVTNQHSLSDAEDFTEGYRTLQLGKVVGEPTAGWIIYTSSVRLVDGSSIRMPFSRITDHEGKDMELVPRQVDIRVDRPIGESYLSNSSQLDTAVKELLKQIGQ
jgi:tricorn protease